MERTDVSELGRRISAGNVPSAKPHGVVASYGKGEDCAICGRSIVDDDVLYTVRWMKMELDMHVTCFERWERACQARGDEDSDSPHVGKRGGVVKHVQ